MEKLKEDLTDLQKLQIEFSNLEKKNNLLEEELKYFKESPKEGLLPGSSSGSEDLEKANLELHQKVQELEKHVANLQEINQKDRTLRNKAQQDAESSLATQKSLLDETSKLHEQISGLKSQIKNIQSDRDLARKSVQIIFDMLGPKLNDLVIELLSDTTEHGYSNRSVSGLIQDAIKRHISK